MIEQINKDIQAVVYNQPLSLKGQALKNALGKYKTGVITAQERAHLVFLIGSILDWKEEEFRAVLDRAGLVISVKDMKCEVNH